MTVALFDFGAAFANSSPGSGITHRAVISAGAISGSGNRIRVQFLWRNQDTVITAATIALQAPSGDVYDADPATITSLTMGGLASFTIKSSSLYTDWLDFSIDGTRAVLLSFYSSGNPFLPVSATPAAGYARYTKLGNETATANATGFAASASYCWLIRSIEADEVAMSTVVAALDQRYGDLMPIARAVEQNYGNVAIVSGALLQPYGLILEQALRQMYSDAAIQTAGLVQPYSDTALVQRGLMQPYGDTVALLRSLDQQYHLMHLSVAGLAQPYAICGLPVVAGCDQPYDLRDRDLIATSLTQHYSLFRDSVVSGLQFSVLVGGVDITGACSQVTWTLSDDAYLIEGSITLHDQAVIRSIAVADAVELTWMGTTYHLFVASKRRASRGISGEFGALEYTVDYLITVRSATAALMDPYALPITMDWPDIGLASTIAADIIGGLSDIITLDWQVEDWLQPGGTFFLTDEIPLEGLRKLAAIIGAELATSPDNHLQVVMPDMVAPDLWSTTAPARIISDNGQIFSDTEAENERTLYNVVTVSNQGAADQSVRFETEDVSEMVKRVKGYRVPWADIALAHSGGAWVTIEDEGIKTEQITETVEIIDGAASASKPVYSQVAARWLQAQLGAITASEDGSLTTEVAGMSLAEITYTTKYHAWLGRDDRSEEVQFYEVQP